MEEAGFDQIYRNVEVSSRYNDVNEVETMKAIIDGLSFSSRLQLHSIWCDSKACSCYSIEACSGADLEPIKWELFDFLRNHSIGHNGVTIHSKQGDVHLDPDWPGDEEGF